MAKIVKIDDAPEGAIELTYPGGSFKVDGRGHKTDDPAALEAARSYPEYFVVEDEEEVAREAPAPSNDTSKSSSAQKGTNPEGKN